MADRTGDGVVGVPLDQLLDGILGVLVDHPGPVPPAEVRGVAILDPDDDPRGHHGELVLVIGPRGRDADPLARAAARGGAAAVAVKSGPGPADPEPASPVLTVRPGVRWDQLVMLLRERLDVADLQAGPGGPGPDGDDLFALAEDVAVATGGMVSVEDAGDRVLAYSRAGEDADELRRLSILGWRGPEPYLRTLREWGVFDRLRAEDRVVRVEEHPELGIRARLAMGIRAGGRYLGTIWVQRGVAPFAPGAEQALVGAARLAAAEMLRRRTGAEPAREGFLADLLTGRASTDLVAGRLGLDPAAPALVVGFAAPPEPDAPARELVREQALGLVAVHATAHHRHALVGLLDGRVYAVLPHTPSRGRAGAAPGWVRHAVRLLRERTGTGVCAGIGQPAPGLAALPAARTEADRVLDALLRVPRDGERAVATIDELRAEVSLAETLDLLAGRPELRHPGVAALAAHDAERGGELVASVLAYLEALGDVRAAAERLTVHPNTLRYRLRRARELSGIDLDDPRERLACHLQLLLADRAGRSSGAREDSRPHRQPSRPSPPVSTSVPVVHKPARVDHPGGVIGAQ